VGIAGRFPKSVPNCPLCVLLAFAGSSKAGTQSLSSVKIRYIPVISGWLGHRAASRPEGRWCTPFDRGSATIGSIDSSANAPSPAPQVTDLAIDRRAVSRRLDLGDGSWVDLVDGFVPDSERLFGEIFDGAPWQQTEVLRLDRYVPEKRLSAGLPKSGPPAATRQIGLHLDATYRVNFTGVAAILYRDGADFQGLHSDREMRWLDDTLIGIVVLGARRPFVLRKRGLSANHADPTPAGEADGDVVLTPGDGDLLVMGGRNQRDWLHGVPAAATDRARISLTWRWTSRRGRPDTNPGYYEGRQFSDRSRQPGARRTLPG
jgi:alkylated DNA repair dioxygenase AlkB